VWSFLLASINQSISQSINQFISQQHTHKFRK